MECVKCFVLLPQEFFRCDYFTDVGAGGLLHKLHCAVERSLAGVDFGGSMSQQVSNSFCKCFVSGAWRSPHLPEPVSTLRASQQHVQGQLHSMVKRSLVGFGFGSSMLQQVSKHCCRRFASGA
jgi:hypothetical protein